MIDGPEELLRRIRLGEDSVLELKAVQVANDRVIAPRRDEFADEIGALANTAGGVVVLGVDDRTRDVIGIAVAKLDAVERFAFEVCNDSIHPPVAFRSLRMELPDSTGVLRPVLQLEIPRSLFVHKSPGGYFRRQGSSKREMPPDVLARLFQQRSQARIIRFDEQIVPQTEPADLDEKLWRRFIGKSNELPESTLRKLNLLAADETGRVRVTVAGVLLCSTTPERWLPGAFISAVRYRGTRPDSNYQADAKEIVGPLDSQVEQALAFVRRNMTLSARKDPVRIETPQFSMRAIFEAVVNAVAHRDYSIHGSKIRMWLFDDRFELYSPGALPNTVSVESIELRQATRNELVTSLLAKCPVPSAADADGRRFLMDKRGEGVPIIIDESLRLSGRSPEYRVIDDAELRLTIWGFQATDSD